MFGIKPKKLRGQLILELESSGKHPDLSLELAWARSEGVTSSDIEQWWNMPDEEHREIIEEDELAKLAFGGQLQSEGVGLERMVETVVRTFPSFGSARDANAGFASVPLPIELKPRINAFMSSQSQAGLTAVRERAMQLGSMNDCIRELIHCGKL